jgi:RpiR family transcriptional regulator, carbohydrate utilization regulator
MAGRMQSDKRSKKKAGKRGAALKAINPGASLVPLIRGRIPSLKRAQRRIAKEIVRDPELFIVQSISELAGRCRVSTGSIVHFCRSLGLRGFPHLKVALARGLSEPLFPSGRKAGAKQGAGEILEMVFQEHTQALRDTLQLNSAATLDSAVKVLLKARRIFLFSIGLSYPVAYSLYARMKFMGYSAYIEYDSHLQLARAAEMGPGDAGLAVSVAGNTSETVECLRLAKERGSKTICITNSIGSPLAEAADIRLYAAPSEVKYFQAPLASRVTQLAVADALLTALGLKRKRQALTHLRRAEEALLKHRV